MAHKFKTVNYTDPLQQTVTIGDCLAVGGNVAFHSQARGRA